MKATRPPWRAFIHWDANCVRLDDVQQSRHPVLSKNGWYAVLAATLDADADLWHDLEVLHISDAFEAKLRDSIGKPRPELEAIRRAVPAGKEAIVMLGTATNRSRKKRDASYLQAVLRALVVRNRPRVQSRYDDQYRGETVSVVLEGDYKPLKVKVLLRPTAKADIQQSSSPKQASRSGTIRRRTKTPNATRHAEPQAGSAPVTTENATTPTTKAIAASLGEGDQGGSGRHLGVSAKFKIAGPGTTSAAGSG